MGANKTIAKNTVFLYLRMLLVMVVSLFTSRVVLQTLGVEDFGINNVVGGLVTTLAFLTGSISSGTSRFYAYYIGKNDKIELNNYYKISVTCFMLLSLIILLLSETIGLWFLNAKMNISPDRMIAANWVYQCAIASFVVNMFIVPHQSMIVSQEHMTVYAYVGIAEVLAKLLVVYVLVIGDTDKLILYSILNFLISVSMLVFYIGYCYKKYDVCRYKLYFKWDKIKGFLSYSVWIIFGALSNIFKDQAINILLNIFFGATINAARGVAYQVNRAVVQFVNNFYMAVRPQVTKRYAAGEMESMYSLVFTSSRMCYYLVFVLSVPLIIEMPMVLKLWLHDVPDHTVLFARLVLLHALIESLAYPLDTSITATGKIRGFQVWTGGMLLLNLPISYIVLKMGASAESTMYVMIVLAVLAHFIRMYFAKKLNGISMTKYLKDVLATIIFVSLVVFGALGFLYTHFMFDTVGGFFLFSALSVCFMMIVIYLLGINRDERVMLKQLVLNKIHKK